MAFELQFRPSGALGDQEIRRQRCESFDEVVDALKAEQVAGLQGHEVVVVCVQGERAELLIEQHVELATYGKVLVQDGPSRRGRVTSRVNSLRTTR